MASTPIRLFNHLGNGGSFTLNGNKTISVSVNYVGYSGTFKYEAGSGEGDADYVSFNVPGITGMSGYSYINAFIRYVSGYKSITLTTNGKTYTFTSSGSTYECTSDWPTISGKKSWTNISCTIKLNS